MAFQFSTTNLLLLLVIIYAICTEIIKTELVVILALLYLLLSKKEGMSERTDVFPWFEPEGYGTSHSMVNPAIKPLMYKYPFKPKDESNEP